MSSGCDELPNLKDETQEGIKGDQSYEMAIPALLQDTSLQQSPEYGYQEDHENAADSHCVIRRREQEEDEINQKYEEIQKELEKVCRHHWIL